MLDTDEEELTIPGSAVNIGVMSYNDITGTPPFAPRPHYGLNSNIDRDKACRTSTSTGRSVTIATASSNQPNSTTGTNTCNIHEICYYFQLFIFISAVLTGFALVIAGAVMHTQYGELVVFVYIGGLLVCVNSALLAIQCFVRRKQKNRLRSYTNTSRHANSSMQGSTGTIMIGNQQYVPVSSMNVMPPSLPTMRGTMPSNLDHCNVESNSRPSPIHLTAMDYRNVPPQSTRSPTYSDLQIKYLSPTHSAISYKQTVTTPAHGHHSRDRSRLHQSPPLGQTQHKITTPYHLAATNFQHSPRANNARDDFITHTIPNYNDVITAGRMPREVNPAAVHLL